MSAKSKNDIDGTLVFKLPKGFDGFSEQEVAQYNQSVLEIQQPEDLQPYEMQDALQFELVFGDVKEHHVLYCEKTQVAILMDKVRGVWIARALAPHAKILHADLVIN
jgi:hypothetical protein